MNERIEPEVIAALLDGTLERSERERVLGRIMASPDEYEELVEIARTLRAMEAVPPATAAPPVDAREATHVAAVAEPRAPAGSRARRIKPAWVALPAAAAAAVVAFLITRPGGDGTRGPLFDPAGAGSIERTFGTAWSRPGWPGTRGEEAIAPEGAAYRAGVLAARYDMAARAVDSTAIREVGSALRALLDTNPDVRPLVREYEDAIAGITEAAPGVVAPSIPDTARGPGSGVSAWYELGRGVEHTRLLAAVDRLDLLESGGRALAAAARAMDDAHPNTAAVRARIDDADRLIAEDGNAERRAELEELLAEVTRIASR